MAQYEGYYPEGELPEIKGVNELAAGLIFFASLMMLLLGSFHFIVGLAALLNDTFYQVRPGFGLELSVTAWGWAHIIGSILLMLAGIGLLTGSAVARIIAILFAAVSAVWNFYSIPYYPLWSVLMLVLYLPILWALIAHGREFANALKEG
jgi:hypothetical protein